MTAKHISRTCPAAAAAQAKVAAAREELLAEEPMRCYPHPITMPAFPPAGTAPTPAMTPILEQLQRHSQLLVDLLGAVNALTAAVLCQCQKNDG